MVDYYVNKSVQSNGDHEVHRDGCRYMPDLNNRLYWEIFNLAQWPKWVTIDRSVLELAHQPHISNTFVMRSIIVTLTVIALLACFESWSIDFHIDSDYGHGAQFFDGSQDDKHEHSEACGHAHCHHSALLTAVQIRALPTSRTLISVPSASVLPRNASRIYRPPIT